MRRDALPELRNCLWRYTAARVDVEPPYEEGREVEGTADDVKEESGPCAASSAGVAEGAAPGDALEPLTMKAPAERKLASMLRASSGSMVLTWVGSAVENDVGATVTVIVTKATPSDTDTGMDSEVRRDE